MRAILIATGSSANLGSLTEQCVSPMLPLVDRSFLQHVIESLAARGFTEFDIVVCQLAHQIEEYFKDGTRWGISIRYHLARDEKQPYRPLRTMSPVIEDTPVLLCHADRLPGIESIDSARRKRGPTLYCSRQLSNVEQSYWTGWGWIDGSNFKGLSVDADEAILFAHLCSENARLVKVRPGLNVLDFPHFSRVTETRLLTLLQTYYSEVARSSRGSGSPVMLSSTPQPV